MFAHFPNIPHLRNGFAQGPILLSVINNLKAKYFINFCLFNAENSTVDNPVEIDELLDFMLQMLFIPVAVLGQTVEGEF